MCWYSYCVRLIYSSTFVITFALYRFGGSFVHKLTRPLSLLTVKSGCEERVFNKNEGCPIFLKTPQRFNKNGILWGPKGPAPKSRYLNKNEKCPPIWNRKDVPIRTRSAPYFPKSRSSQPDFTVLSYLSLLIVWWMVSITSIMWGYHRDRLCRSCCAVSISLKLRNEWRDDWKKLQRNGVMFQFFIWLCGM